MFATPKAASRKTERNYSQKEKDQILENFDIEFKSRLKTIETELEDHLNKLIIFSKNQITRLPINVRNTTLREFGEKYNGDLNALVRGIAQVNALRMNPAPPTVGKRKRDEPGDETSDGNPRHTKTARQASASPQKRSMVPPTPGTARKAPTNSRGLPSRGAYLTTSTSIPQPSTPSARQQRKEKPGTPQRGGFPHTSSTFNPTTNTALPAYPRPMRRDETLLSKNGSPVANPFSSGPILFNPGGHDRTSGIVVAREPSSSFSSLRDSSSTAHSIATTATLAGDSVPSSWLQLQTQSGHTVAFDPQHTTPNELDARDDLTETDKKEIAEHMIRLTEAFRALRWDKHV